MDLSPEHLDRHPFRIRRRGYDIMQVRKLLREIGEELRARQSLRDQLGEDADPRALAEREAAEIVARAEARADRILADASGTPPPVDLEAETLLEDARAQAARIVEDAEAAARERSRVVLADAQVRLDRLIDRERDLTAKLRVTEQRLRELSGGEITAGGRDLGGMESHRAEVIELTPASRSELERESAVDDSFAEFMKSTLRQELDVGRPV